MVGVWRRTERGEAPRWQGATTANICARSNAASAGVPNAAAALGWSWDAAPVECSQSFTAGCTVFGRRGCVFRALAQTPGLRGRLDVLLDDGITGGTDAVAELR